MTIFHLLRHGQHGLGGRVLAGRMPGSRPDRTRPRRDRRGRRAARRRQDRGDLCEPVAAHPRERRDRRRAAGSADRISRRSDRAGFRRVDRQDLRRDPRRPALARRGTRGAACRAIPGGETNARGAAPRRRGACSKSTRAIRTTVRGGQPRRRDPGRAVVRARHAARFLQPIEVAQGSVSTVRIDAGGVRVIAINERPQGVENIAYFRLQRCASSQARLSTALGKPYNSFIAIVREIRREEPDVSQRPPL